jgi:hypothetical protein
MLPATNPTAPSEPPSFAATPQINGTILFEWTRPIVQPAGTEFQIIRTTNSANAAVGTVVWRGNASPVPLVMPTSRHWYYVRAVANSAFSPYTPNTFGVMAAPRGEASDPRVFIISDPEFGLSRENGDFWFNGNTAVFSINPTLGLGGGALVISGPTSATMWAVPKMPYARTREGQMRVSIRVFCASYSVAGSATAWQFVAKPWNGVSTPTNSNTDLSNNGGGVVVGALGHFSGTNSVNQGRWMSLTTVVSVDLVKATTPAAINPTSYPYWAFRISPTNAAIGQWYVDLLTCDYV